MLPAHGYPELKKHPQLKGNFGTAWQSQQKEFAEHPRAGAVSPPTASCRRAPATQTASTRPRSVGYPGLRHIARTRGTQGLLPAHRAGRARSAAIRNDQEHAPASTAAHTVTTGFAPRRGPGATPAGRLTRCKSGDASGTSSWSAAATARIRAATTTPSS